MKVTSNLFKAENIFPGLILCYIFWPFVRLEESPLLYLFSFINTYLWIIFLLNKLDLEKSWNIPVSLFIFIPLSYTNIINDTLMSFLLLTTLLSPYLVRRIFPKKQRSLSHMTILFIVDGIIFLILAFIGSHVLIKLEPISLTAMQYGSAFLFSITLFISIYLIKYLFNSLIYLMEKGQHLSKELFIFFIFTGIFLLLTIPDIMFAKFIYGVYLEAIENKKYAFIDLYYFSFSMHFLTPLFSEGREIQEILDSVFGKSIYIAHMLTVRVIDITVIATISSILIKQINPKRV